MKNNMNMTRIHKYVKIIWIKENICQNLYNTLNIIRYEKKTQTPHTYTNYRIQGRVKGV